MNIFSLGRYRSYYRHVPVCEYCTPKVTAQKRAKKRKREQEFRAQSQGIAIIASYDTLVEQKPASEWAVKRVKLETGLTSEQIDHIEQLCSSELLKDPSRHPYSLAPRNLLLLTLKWLWRYPPIELLAEEFEIANGTARNLISRVLEILDKQLEYLRKWQPLGRQRIKEGEFKNSVGSIDTFPICILQPPAGERKQYYIYKRGHRSSYGWKVQLFTDFHGRVNSVSAAYPYGLIADITLLKASEMGARLGPSCRALSFKHDLETQIENRLAAARESQPQQLEPEESRTNNYILALGDKAYQGHPHVYVPHKRYTRKRMT